MLQINDMRQHSFAKQIICIIHSLPRNISLVQIPVPFGIPGNTVGDIVAIEELTLIPFRDIPSTHFRILDLNSSHPSAQPGNPSGSVSPSVHQ